jgi:hypothetical protein
MFMAKLQSIGALYITGQKIARDGEVGKAQFLDVLHQPET